MTRIRDRLWEPLSHYQMSKAMNWRPGMGIVRKEIAGRIVAVGSAMPAQVTTNADLAAEFGVTEEWIERRCGVERRYVATTETTTTLGAAAARKALADSAVRPDLLLCATFSPDRVLTPIAPSIAYHAGLGSIAAFDLNAACSGGVTALISALAFISSGLFRNVLVVATDTTTKHLDPADLKTRMLFSDGAAAILLGPPRADATTLHVRAHRFGSDGTGAGFFSADWIARQPGARPYVRMDGASLFQFAVETGVRTLSTLCADADLPPEHLTRILMHQANARIAGAIRKSFAISKEKWPETIRMGNVAGASLLFLLVQEFTRRSFVCGELLALIAFGAGLTWAGTILEAGC